MTRRKQKKILKRNSLTLHFAPVLHCCICHSCHTAIEFQTLSALSTSINHAFTQTLWASRRRSRKRSHPPAKFLNSPPKHIHLCVFAETFQFVFFKFVRCALFPACTCSFVLQYTYLCVRFSLATVVCFMFVCLFCFVFFFFRKTLKVRPPFHSVPVAFDSVSNWCCTI